MQAPCRWMLLAVTLILAGYGFAGSRNRPLKVASLNIDRAVFDTEQGKREAGELAKILELKQRELKALGTEIGNLKQRLKDHAAELSDADRGAMQAEIDTKQKTLDSSTQRVKEESQAARLKLRGSIVEKMASIVVSIGKQKHLNAILDASPGAAPDPNKFWPDGLVLWSSGADIDLKEASSTKPEIDITDNVVQKYNAAHP